MTAYVDHAFDALGTTVRVLVLAPDGKERAAHVEALVRDYHRRLSRFRPDSELSALNADPRAEVPASALLRDAVAAALTAAHASHGLVDPTLLDALERAGYTRSLAHAEPIEPGPPAKPRPARPHPDARWRQIEVTDTTIRRPSGLRLDLGGTGKGHVADLAATRILEGARRYAIDAGGDIRVGGTEGEQEIEIERTGRSLVVAAGAVATSATHRRAWRTADGAIAHHLLDPATGRPAHTGVVQATARAATVAEAETRAKRALLEGAGTELHDVLLVTDSGEVIAR